MAEDEDLGRSFLNDDDDDDENKNEVEEDKIGETLILQSIKKKKEERSKKLNSIYMSYEKLDEKLFLNQDGVKHTDQGQDEAEVWNIFFVFYSSFFYVSLFVFVRCCLCFFKHFSEVLLKCTIYAGTLMLMMSI